MPTIVTPDYGGGSLLNLVAELEARLGGDPPSTRLRPELAARIPGAASYLVVLFDGLGRDQLGHPAAGSMRDADAGPIDAVFPTTTTVNLATVATGLPPSRHGLLGYQSWLPEVQQVVNTIKWTTLWGEPVDYDTGRFLPEPNLWERLGRIGVETITVEPLHFRDSPMSRMLYRGCRFEGVSTYDDLVRASLDLAAVPGRLVFTYVAAVDFAAHTAGQRSPEYAHAVALADRVWSHLASALPPGVALIGTADHGHVDFPRNRQVRISRADHADRIFYGDGRAMFVRGEGASLAERLPATWVPAEDVEPWWGPGPAHPAFGERRPDGVLVADDDRLLLHRFSDDRMIGNHGALTPAELRVPMLVVPPVPG